MRVVYHKEPFKIKTLPLTDIHVIDNWLTPELWAFFNEKISQMNIWSQSNQVYKFGKIRHRFWGCTFFRENYRLEHDMNPEYSYFVEFLDRKLQHEFGFKWTDFQYAGMNSQTEGLQGTIHEDCPDDMPNNLSFLWYNQTYWPKRFGGKLRIYDSSGKDISGFHSDFAEEHQVAEIDYIPNRLLVFDGRLPHNADAPVKSKYHPRTSLVIRGNDVRLCTKEEFY
jgi:hypothetical protein